MFDCPRPVFAILLATLLATSAAAQYWRPIPFAPTLPPDAVATGTLAGNFTGHGYPDLAFLLGSQVALCTAPSVHNATTPIAAGVAAVGLATMPGGGTFGRDGLAIATSDGLWQWSVDAPTLESLDPAVDWRSVACGDLDGHEPCDLVGVVGSARDRLRICLRDDSATPAHAVVELAFTGQTIADVVLAQWNDTAPLEIVVATNQRLWVGTPDTVLRQLVLGNDGDSRLARVRMQPCDHVAWWVRVAGQASLHGISRLGHSQTDAAALGQVTHVAAGDYDGNDADDLVVTAAACPPKLVMNDRLPTAAVAGFDVAQATAMTPFGVVQPVMQAFGAAWLGDLDGDGNVDLFAPWRFTTPANVSSSSVWIHVQQSGLSPRPPLAEITADGTPAQPRFVVTVDPWLVPPAAATHLELLVFGVHADGGSMALDPVGLERVRAALPAESIAFTVDAGPTTPRAFAGLLRWVEVAAGATTRVWSPTRFVFALDGDVVPYSLWRLARAEEVAIPTFMLYQTETATETSTNRYLLRPLPVEPVPPIIHESHSGDEEPPDLPPPPPVPPKPPTPPPPGG
ncbi:MAG TPA: hypothetical protein VFZ65_12970 [Planctomycetota bacterium]|nr:hypothetical protein [Planctomycetota bacterium]